MSALIALVGCILRCDRRRADGLRGNAGMAIIFTGYAFSNIGLYWPARAAA